MNVDDDDDDSGPRPLHCSRAGPDCKGEAFGGFRLRQERFWGGVKRWGAERLAVGNVTG